MQLHKDFLDFCFKRWESFPNSKKNGNKWDVNIPPDLKIVFKKSHLVPSSPRIHHEVASAAGEENDVLWMAGICDSSCCGALIYIYIYI